MKIAIIGYGKMGQAVEAAALVQGHSIVGRFSSEAWDEEALKAADVCIEFTQPDAAVENIKKIAPLAKNLVVGTTGWHHRLEEVRELVDYYGIGLLYSPNFALGVNIFYELLNQASKLFNSFPGYDVAGIEYHHSQKKDSPSGFACRMADLIKGNMPGRTDMSISSVRCGKIIGIHTLLFDSEFDTVTLTHESKNRQGFAAGAIQAAEWLQGKTGLFTFTDCIKNIFERNEG